MKGLWSLRGFAKKYWRILIVALLVMAAAGGLTGYSIYWTKEVFEPLLGSLSGLDEPAHIAELQLLLYRALMLFGLLSAAAVATAAATYLGEWIGQKILLDLRTTLFEHLQNLSMKFFDRQRSGELISRVNNDTMLLQHVLGSQLAQLVVAPVTTLVSFGFMIKLSWHLTLLMLAIAPAVYFITRILGGWVRRYSYLVQSRLADLTSAIEEGFSLIRVIKIFGMESQVQRRFNGAAEGVLRGELRSARVRVSSQMTTMILVSLSLCGALLFGGYEIMAGNITPGELMAFVLLMQSAGANVSRLTRLRLSLERGEVAAQRTLELLEQTTDVSDAPDAVELEQVAGRVRFENVEFSYDSGTRVLKDLDLDIKPGETVALVGPSGAGKTTVGSLVPRLYDVDSGRVLVDEIDVREVTQASLRSFMGFVPQETLLFAGTVKENIAFGWPEASAAEIVAAAQAANAHDFIEALPEGYETMVGERGVKLSGGQRQRLAIARALLRDPRILILDEATSSLDQESERAVHQALDTLLHGRTAIIIAHRLSTIRNADRIVVLAEGRIVQQGTHEELIAQEGLYRRLYQSAEAQHTGRIAHTEATLSSDTPAT